MEKYYGWKDATVDVELRMKTALYNGWKLHAGSGWRHLTFPLQPACVTQHSMFIIATLGTDWAYLGNFQNFQHSVLSSAQDAQRSKQFMFAIVSF
jgi:hypothetical protein